jgi:hypothetical protein
MMPFVLFVQLSLFLFFFYIRSVSFQVLYLGHVGVRASGICHCHTWLEVDAVLRDAGRIWSLTMGSITVVLV